MRGQTRFNPVFDRPQPRPRPILICHDAQLTQPPHVRPSTLASQHLVPDASPGHVHHRVQTTLQRSAPGSPSSARNVSRRRASSSACASSTSSPDPVSCLHLTIAREIAAPTWDSRYYAHRITESEAVETDEASDSSISEKGRYWPKGQTPH